MSIPVPRDGWREADRWAVILGDYVPPPRLNRVSHFRRTSTSGKRDHALDIALSVSAITPAEAQPGDIGVGHSKGAIGFLIRLFTRSKWNHVFVITSAGATPQDIGVIQAEAHGVLRATLADVAPGGSYAILPCPPGVSRDLVVAEATALLRTKYGFVSIVSILVNLGLPFLRLEVHEGSTLICSAVGALALFHGGWDQQWSDFYAVTPAGLAAALAPATPLV